MPSELSPTEISQLKKLLANLNTDRWVAPVLNSGLPRPPLRTELPTASKDYEGLLCAVPASTGVAGRYWLCRETAAGGAYEWVALDNASEMPNLTAIDFLVGTASGLLSGEIAVGTTPGGELGNTWASPTVDTTHSGSSHAGVISTHEAAGDPHTGYVLEAATPGGELGGTYAAPTVNATHSGSTHASLAVAIPEFLTPLNLPEAFISTANAQSANQAYWTPILPLTADVTIETLAGAVVVQNGNIDVGVYSFDGTTMTKVVTLGSTACPAAATFVSFNIANTALTRGTRYFFAYATDSATLRIAKINYALNTAFIPTSGPMWTKASSFPLPATAASLVAVTQGPMLIGTVTGGSTL